VTCANCRHVFQWPIEERKTGDAKNIPMHSEAPEEIIHKLTDSQLLCPVCWLPIEKGDLMHIAVHDSLRGDPILGEDVALRFHASQFDPTFPR